MLVFRQLLFLYLGSQYMQWITILFVFLGATLLVCYVFHCLFTRLLYSQKMKAIILEKKSGQPKICFLQTLRSAFGQFEKNISFYRRECFTFMDIHSDSKSALISRFLILAMYRGGFYARPESAPSPDFYRYLKNCGRVSNPPLQTTTAA